MVEYNFKEDFLMIRRCLGLSQEAFAKEVGLSRSNIARYESGAIEPRFEVANRIYDYAFSRGFDINSSKAMLFEDERKGMKLLFHGAKGKIVGDIDNIHSIPPNDFADGFYLGESLNQAASWVSTSPLSSVYCFYFAPNEKLKGISFEVNEEWMYAILFYRGLLNGYKIPPKYAKVLKKIDSCDYIEAPIADNRMYDTLELFKNGFITDKACLHALSANNLGFQLVAKSMDACKELVPLARFFISSEEREYYSNLKVRQNDEGRNKMRLSLEKYRREGKYFNEIFEREG